MRILGWGLLFAFALSSGGCTSMSAMQTGRVLPEGSYRFLGALGLFRTPVVSPSEPDRANFPYVEGGVRFGFTEGWDLGFRYTMPGTFTGDLKFNIYEDEAFAWAMGFGVGWLAIKADASDTDHLKREILDLLFPAYLSYDFTPVWGTYVSPRFVLRFAQSQQNLVGRAIGLRCGNSVGIFLELSGAADVTSDFRQYQAGLGFFIGGAPHVASKN